MAYIRTEQVKAIRENLKKRFPNIKFSVRKNAHSSTVCVTILQSDINFFADVVKDRFARDLSKESYIDINPYWYREHFTGKSLEVITEIENIIKTTAPHYDRSDAMSDYFDVAYYIDMSIGSWDKPYQLVA